jgi:hypothetical protein
MISYNVEIPENEKEFLNKTVTFHLLYRLIF